MTLTFTPWIEYLVTASDGHEWSLCLDSHGRLMCDAVRVSDGATMDLPIARVVFGVLIIPARVEALWAQAAREYAELAGFIPRTGHEGCGFQEKQ